MFTIGCDPELFLVDGEKGVSAYGMIPGTKESPHKTPHGAIQVDGMALEFNTEPVPIANFDRFNQNIVRTIDDLLQATRENGFKGTFSRDPVMVFDKEYMDSQPDDAKVLGCDPDWNAYTLELNPTPDGNVDFRGAGGHIHLGWGTDIPVDNPEHLQICADIVKTLDAYVGVFMTYIDRDPRRRNMYGKAGAFRPKPYGVEYRSPSNAWIWTKSRRRMIHNLVRLSIQRQQSGGISFELQTRGQSIIDTGDWQKAKQVLEGIVDRHGLNGVWASLHKEKAIIALEGNH